MSTELDNGDGELLGLLEELAGQEERVVLNASIRGIRRRLTGPVERISPRMAGLSSLERLLLSAHREALGRLVMEACLETLMKDAAAVPTVFLNHHRSGAVHAPWDSRAVLDEFGKLRCVASGSSNTKALEPILFRLASASAEDRPDLQALADAGLRVSPSEPLRYYKALGLLQRGKGVGAKIIAQDIHANPIRHANKLRAAGLIGRIHFSRGEFPDAAVWFERSASSPEPYPTGVYGWAVSALQAGDENGLCRASEYLGDIQNGQDGAVDRYLKAKRAARVSRSWSPTRQACLLANNRKSHAECLEEILELFR